MVWDQEGLEMGEGLRRKTCLGGRRVGEVEGLGRKEGLEQELLGWSMLFFFFF